MGKKQKNEEVNIEEKKKHGFLWNFFKVILIIVLFIGLFVGGFLGYSTLKNGWGLKGIVQTVVGSDIGSIPIKFLVE